MKDGFVRAHGAQSIRVVFVMAVFTLTCALHAQKVDETAAKANISNEPLSAEQLAIYRAVLHDWMDDGKQPINLSIQTAPRPDDIADCAKGIQLEAGDPLLVHHFQNEDLANLGSAKLHIVDPDAQEREVSKNDPGDAIRNGRTVDDAVRNGFNHGLLTLGEIQFDQKHETAIVWYGFHCGALCGNGATVILKKKNGVWKRTGFCSVWMS